MDLFILFTEIFMSVAASIAKQNEFMRFQEAEVFHIQKSGSGVNKFQHAVHKKFHG